MLKLQPVATYRVRGIIIGNRPVGEADKLITLYTEEHGKLIALARGARRPKSRVGGRLEIFSYNDCFLARGRSRDIFAQAETIKSFRALRENLDLLATGAYLIKLVDAASPLGQTNQKLFELLLAALNLLDQRVDTATLARVFEVRLTETEGFFPSLFKCSKCQIGVVDHPFPLGFSERFGGVLCPRCLTVDPYAMGISDETRKMMLKIKDQPLPALFDRPFPAEVIRNLDQILPPYLSEHVGRNIRELQTLGI